MRSRRVILISILGLAISVSLSQHPTTRTQYLEEVVRANPGIRMSDAVSEQATARLNGAGAWDPPMLRATFMDTPTSSANPFGSSRDTRLNIEQMIPFPGKKGYEQDISRSGVDLAQADFRQVVVDTRTTAKILYARAQGGTEQVALLEEQQALLDQMLRSVESRYSVGSASQADLLRLRIEREKLTNLTSSLRTDVQTVLFRMNALRGREPDAPFGTLVPVSIPFPSSTPESLTHIALTNRPDLLRASAQVTSFEAIRAHAGRSYYPDLNLGLGLRDNLLMGTTWELMLGVSIPIAPWSSTAFSGRKAEAEAGIRASKALLEDRTLAGRLETAELYQAASLRYDRLMRYMDTIIPDARQALEVLTTAYQTGRTDFLSFIDSFRQLETLLLEMIDERIAYHTAIAHLEQALGSDLDSSKEEDVQ